MTPFGIPADALGAYVGIAAFLVAVAALLREMRHTTKVRQVDLMLKYWDMFDSERSRKNRLALCKFLSEKRPFDAEDAEWDKVSPVMDFFQDLAQRTRYGGLPMPFVHGDYFYWLANYWKACSSYIEHYRSKAPMYLMDVVWLYEKCRRIDLKRNEGAYSNVTHEDVDDFLTFEITTLSESDA